MSEAMRVLVVDHGEASSTLVAELAEWRYQVETATVGAAVADAADGDADVVIVDRQLADVDGLDVCRALRRQRRAPIIVLTGNNDENERIAAIETGADHYMAKPVVVRELVARVRATRRRAGDGSTRWSGCSASPTACGSNASARRSDELVVDRRTRRVRVGQRLVYLTPKEYELLVFLIDGGDRAHSESSLMANIWDAHWYGSTKTVGTHIGKLRAKLTGAVTITKVGPAGYRFEVNAARPADVAAG